MSGVDRATSWASSPGVARSMRSNKRRDTGPELAIRRLVHASGYRYRVDFAADPSRPRLRADLVFTSVKLAVFIDGCFWHGCPVHATMPVRNRDYWEPKLLRNVDRDRTTTESLRRNGWTVLRIWEHVPPAEAARSITDEVDRLRARAAAARIDPSVRSTEESDRHD